MRVLHVLPTKASEYGGPVAVAEEMARELTVQGVKTSIFPPDIESYPEYKYWKKFTGVKVAVSKCDLIHIHCLWNFSSSVAVFLAIRAGIPYVITPHGMLDRWALSRSRWKKFFFSILFEKRNLAGASGVHFLNNEELGEAKDFDVHLTPFVLPNGVRKLQDSVPPSRAELEKYYPQFKKKFLPLFMGRLHPKKGIDLLLLAISEAVKVVPNIHLIIAGPDENGYKSTLEGIIDTNNLSQHVSFIGMIRDRRKFEVLNAADFFVLSSHQEGDSIAIKEAMAAHLPVIITPACHFPDVMRYNLGRVIEPDIVQLTQALVDFSLSPEDRNLMGKNACRIVNQQYIWPKIVKRLLHIYKDILNKNKTSVDWRIES
jgi:glycosyltransferase involved in cell wall biosynthesis